MNKLAPWVMAAAALSLCTGLQADANIKPGLWEIQQQGSTDDGDVKSLELPDAAQMQAALDNLPPEIRAQARSQLAKSGIVAGSKGMQVCITPEQAANGVFAADPDNACQVLSSERHGNTIKTRMQCNHGTVEAEITVHSPESWSSVTDSVATQQGNSLKLHMEAKGRWVSAACPPT